MHRKIYITVFMLIGALGASCTNAQQPFDGLGMPKPACNFDDIIGMKASNVDASRYGSRTVRVLHPDQPATMDYSPARVNVIIDENEIITSVNCG